NESEQDEAGPDFLLYHLTKRIAAAPDRREQNDHVMDTSAKRCADQNPKRPRQESELRSEHRSNQRPGSSNRRKMVSKNHPSIGRHIILIAILQDCGRGALFI